MWTRRKKAGPARDVDASAGANLDPAAVRAIAIANAIDASMAVIQFTADGAIVDANDLFLATMGYARDDVVGRHHRMFVDPAHADSAEYRAFWRDLATGVPKSAEFERVGRDRRQLWIQATYSPIRGADGAVQGVVKVAADITSRKQRDLYNAAILTAVDRTQAMIEFEPDGTILNANRGFLDVMGFRLADVVGQHHRIFMPPDRVASPDYDDHWRMLAAGHAQQGEFERRNKAGEPVFIHATYTPIQDDRGRVVRIVKFATDMTAQVLARRSTAVAESIARSITELAASSAEINQRVADTASRSTHLAESSGGAKQLVADLDSASGEISHVVDFIRDLADQTNLLA
ncbi:MAG: PAS domain-containing methyl-accepting chemotaxis protein, partial [Planctomycetes bacterium]|nr:PAS domain-containing methyl-accepting chemotaxis protein [Planctomycetota bacterium]